MQNVALAYKQTQAGTTGQDEVLLMLFDGALRFLAQAREKIEAKDYAAKGILISRSLDIINELDSSLNMELGGELSKNLHQLYFLCTTRLLQANLKLDVPKLDSVVEILTGLRSAFAEVVARPEAKAACAQISARNAGKHANVTASRPLSSSGGQMPPGTGGNQGDGQMPATSARTAAGLYGQQNHGGQPAAVPPQPMAQAALLATQMVTQNTFGVAAPQAASAVAPQAVKVAPPMAPPAAPLASAPASRIMAQAYGHVAKPAMGETPHSAQITPAAVPAPAPAAPRVGGFAGKRLAMYGKS